MVDTYGIEFIHPIRAGRSPGQLGKKGKSNYRWIVGGKLCLVLNRLGLVVAWGCETANVHDTAFQHLIARFAEQMVNWAIRASIAHSTTPPTSQSAWNERIV